MLCRRGDGGRDASGPGRGSWPRRCRPNVPSSMPTCASSTSGGFDRALVDAPCSGLGVLARRPDLRWRARPLPELQLELLRAAAARTKTGGTIVYAVCTLNADENEAVVDALRAGRRAARRRVAAVRAPVAAGVPAHAAGPRPHERLLHRPLAGCIGSKRGLAGLDSRGSRWSRRSTARTSRVSASRSRRCSTRAAGSSISTSATGISSSR